MLGKKVIRSMIILVCLVAVWVVGTEKEVHAATDGLYEYEVNGDGKAVVTYYTGSGGFLNIPSQLGGLDVVEIKDQAFYLTGVPGVSNAITGVTIPNTVTRIGNLAFYKQGNLAVANIPDSVTFIGEHAFNGNALTSVDLPSNLTVISDSAFGNNNLTSLTIPENVTDIENGAFASNNLTSIIIPENVTSIGAEAFYGNKLTNIIIPETVASIGGMAFGENKLISATFLRSDTVFESGGIPSTTDPFGDKYPDDPIMFPPQDVTIYGYDSSTAQDLADDYGYTFKAITDLSGLALSAGSLDPVFDSDTQSYTADVANNVSSITVTPTAVDSLAGITVNSATVTSGNASAPISLGVGANTITVIVTAQDSSTKTYTVVVTRASAPKAITGFSFATPSATGVVNEADHTIAITVPYGTDVTTLTPTIVHTGASISPNSGVAQDFSSPVIYTVTAADSTTQTYEVTVTVAANPAKAITAFNFAAPSATGAVNEADHTIAITVPYGTDVTTLTPTIVHTGASISPNSGVAQDFSSPVTYTVTAADSTTQTYEVTVTVAANPAKAITAFSFATPSATGAVNEADHTIAITMPYGTDVTTLTPTIVHTGASISPDSGVAQDFSSPVIYTVTAADNTTQTYEVTVTVAANPAKAITAFDFAAPSATGAVNEADHTIALTVPYGTDVTSLTPTIVHTGASISPDSGVVQDFSSPVTYTVTAADSTIQNYEVTVTVAPKPAPAIPQHLIANGGDSQVTLNWETVTDATYYNVYMSTVQGQFTETPAATVIEPTHTMIGLTNGLTYYFIVKAGHSVSLGAASNEAEATPAKVPDAPTQVTAVAGDGQATVSFMPPADQGGYVVTNYEVTASSGGIVQHGTSGPITVTGLTNGVSYTFTVKAINHIGSSIASDPSNAVIPSAPSDDHGSSEEPEDSDDEPEPGDTEAPLADILLNQQVVYSGAFAATNQDQTILTIAVDRTILDERLAAAQQGAIITYRANASFDKIVAELDGGWVKNMAEKQAVILLKTGQATYELPARLIDIDAAASQFGESVELQDMKLRIEIDTRVAQDTVKTIEEAASNERLTLLTSPIAFMVQATYGDVTVEISKFDTYIERWISIPDTVNQHGVATAVVMESDSTFRSVPTQVVMREGRYYAKVNSLDNGTFTIASHPDTAFSDVDHHWAEQTVHDMVMRMIITGMGDGTFEPNRQITRAEFVTILVRGLGLPIEKGTAPFADINRLNWYNPIVHTTYVYQFIYGYEDGTFRPKDLITREQAMVIISRAMKLTGLDAKLSGRTVNETLLPYTDTTSASDWALAGIVDTIRSGVVQGRSGTTLAPLDFLTRAEAAMIVQRLLELSDLI